MHDTDETSISIYFIIGEYALCKCKKKKRIIAMNLSTSLYAELAKECLSLQHIKYFHNEAKSTEHPKHNSTYSSRFLKYILKLVYISQNTTN